MKTYNILLSKYGAFNFNKIFGTIYTVKRRNMFTEEISGGNDHKQNHTLLIKHKINLIQRQLKCR